MLDLENSDYLDYVPGPEKKNMKKDWSVQQTN